MKTTAYITCLLLTFLIFLNSFIWRDKNFGEISNKKGELITGSDQTEKYIAYLKGKRIAIVASPASVINTTPIVDSLLKRGVNIVKIFGTEHGFRGNSSAGAKVDDEIDPQTGIPIISLYGKKVKPTKVDLAGIDLVMFDIQEGGARFFTKIATLDYVMEACAENGLELMIMDRPNPNASYVDGPVLDMKLKSLTGMFPIPITHGLTIAELARMINGEGWLANKIKCRLNIIKIANYTHNTPYTLPIPPTPNLNTQQAVLLYPSLCLFEATAISQGRGTPFPFTVLGSPDLKGKYSFTFKPVSIPGMSDNPPHQDKDCYGLDLREYDTSVFSKSGHINLSWLKELYDAYPKKEEFFHAERFDQLAGTSELRKQIIAGIPEAEIRQSWEPGLSQYKEMRKKYLLYP